MQEAPHPSDEHERIAALESYDVLDTLPERAYDDITYIAAQICDTPIALMSLVDSERQWFKSKVGIEAAETPRDIAFCAHAILDPGQLFTVEDASSDLRFTDNPLVTQDPNIRFYAGAPLVTSQGQALGTLCVIDRHPHALDEAQRESLRALARQVMAQLELRRSIVDLGATTADLQKTQVALEQSNRDLERFAYIAAHDLKEPLRMIASFTELLTESLGDRLTEDERQFFHHIEDGAARGQALTSDILEYSKLDQDGERAWVDLPQVVAIVSRDAERFRSGARVVCDCTNIPKLWGNAGQLTRLLENLVSNGLKYNDSDTPTVRIGVERHAGGAQITISDNGLGIAPELKEKVFDMFFRAHDRSRYEGTGIGLAICRRIIELHGGDLTVQSEPGEGSVFTCKFPNVSAPEGAADESDYDLAS